MPFDGAIFYRLDPSTGQSKTLRQNFEYDVSTTSTFKAVSALRCRKTNSKRCTAKVRVGIFTTKWIVQVQTLTLPRDGGWHTYVLTTTPFALAAGLAKYSVQVYDEVDVDLIMLTPVAF